MSNGVSRILLIEDDESIAELQKDYLEINHMEAEIACDGLIGLNRALNESFDLIVIDIMLPSMDGFEICRRIREKKNIPLMIVSAKKEDIDKVRGLGLGADDYMTKPFSPSELVARVQAHIKRYQLLTGADTANDIIEINQIRIDKSAHRVFVLGEEIIFTTKEFELLLFFMENPNRVWMKEQLFRQVWDMDDFDTDIYTVVVHIGRIREKLKKGKLSESPIETIWGSGYRFNT
ncbi:DNA-binding response regulator [Enterococcus moraviensis ATCC BAA-383]|uniref:DNA-binding response regulator n=1 Tax=Enterococcus moraviensis ATCC BAA-383 TaxID=1158609 RepID=R2R5N0_9ENTE|nr:response regulator transcription factor [Enterococcus moraviensis]EOI03121.1 DNA-binding response regulator [Enterococcus moraviensis ATCC BAA-383]EOT74002.1 DNA-binding response regulator [Enterococcus moraviensis ATCC BAA-383]OJG67307.1 DNA-binding response regulator [Enterococcus moraviensis]